MIIINNNYNNNDNNNNNYNSNKTKTTKLLVSITAISFSRWTPNELLVQYYSFRVNLTRRYMQESVFHQQQYQHQQQQRKHIPSAIIPGFYSIARRYLLLLKALNLSNFFFPSVSFLPFFFLSRYVVWLQHSIMTCKMIIGFLVANIDNWKPVKYIYWYITTFVCVCDVC